MYSACALCLQDRKINDKIYYALLGIKINNIYKLRIALFVHKIQNDTKGIPAIISDGLTSVSD